MRTVKLTLVCVLIGLFGTACGAQLRHAGYTKSKVWYHWQHNGDGHHSLVVCDVQPNGSETNCQESEI